MEKTFNDVIEAFNSLKTKFQAGEIPRQEFIDEMKKLRIRDDQGRFWMIGAQTGKWYFFDGKDWVQGEPPSSQGRTSTCAFCGFENKPGAAACVRCGGTIGEEPAACPRCGAKLQKPFMTCPRCGTTPSPPAESVKTGPLPTPVSNEAKSDALVLRSVRPSSFFLFGGILGVFLGIVLGAFAGVSDAVLPYLRFLPKVLMSVQGKLLGALIFGFLGGVVGFLVLGYLAFLKAIVLNLILSLMGGLRFRAHSDSLLPRARKRPKTRAGDDAAGRD